MRQLKILLIIYISLLSLVTLTLQAEDNKSNLNDTPEDILKKSKLTACINLSKSRFTKDEFLIDEIVDLMIIHTGGEKKEKTDKLISMILLTCYQKISSKQIENLISKKDDEIDSLSSENKELFGLEKWKKLYEENDTKGLKKEIDNLTKTMKEIQDDETKEEVKGEENKEEKKEKKKAFGLFGLNFKDMNNSIKNIIGFTFLGVILLLALYALKMLKKTEKKKVKKEKSKDK